MRVDKRESSQLSCLGQTRTRITRELMRVDKRELTSESLHKSFLNLPRPGQTRTRVTRKLTIANIPYSLNVDHII